MEILLDRSEQNDYSKTEKAECDINTGIIGGDKNHIIHFDDYFIREDGKHSYQVTWMGCPECGAIIDGEQMQAGVFSIPIGGYGKYHDFIGFYNERHAGAGNFENPSFTLEVAMKIAEVMGSNLVYDKYKDVFIDNYDPEQEPNEYEGYQPLLGEGIDETLYQIGGGGWIWELKEEGIHA